MDNEHSRADSLPPEDLDARIERAVRHREKLDMVARFLKLESENEVLEATLSWKARELASETSSESTAGRVVTARQSSGAASPASRGAGCELPRPRGRGTPSEVVLLVSVRSLALDPGSAKAIRRALR